MGNYADGLLLGLSSSKSLLFRSTRRVRFLAHALMAIFAVAGWSSAYGQPTLQVLHNHVRMEVTEGKAPPAGAMADDQRLNVSIVLALRNKVELDQLLARLYDPSSPDYRQFLSVAEFTEKFGPAAKDYAAVVDFAQVNGLQVTANPANRLIVPVSGTVDAINKAFHVRMSLYQHPTENRLFFSPDREPSLALAVPVAHVAGLNNYSLPRPLVKQAQERQAASTYSGSGPGGLYLGSDMRAAYYGATQLTGEGQAVGLVEWGGYYLSDVNLTFSSASQSYSVPINNVLLDGAIAEPVDGAADAEQVLDIVQAIGMAPGLSQVRVYIGNGPDDANVLNAMASENIAKVLSCSWGWLPEDAATDDVFFKEFAAQGQSFLTASGDSGAFDANLDPYFYPQEDQYVTAVGGTHLTVWSAGGAWSAEAAWNNLGAGSGGGVSPDGIPLPSWQAGLANSLNNGSTTLRNVPDVAMEADFDNYNCELGRCDGAWAGTSFAAPRWAGFIALVNQQAVEAGTAPKGGIGFLNPSLSGIGTGSQYSSDFHDVVSGNNLTFYQPLWYNAVPGYDLVTGWGSPTGQDLIDDLAGKQMPGFWLSASSPEVAMNPGASGSTTITVVDAGGFSGTVKLAITSALPAGVTAKWGTNPTSGSSVLTFTAASTAANASTTVTITGTSGSITKTTQIALTVHTPSFSLSTMPGNLDLGTGKSAAATVVVTPLYGFTGSVKLAVSGLPAGVTAALATNPTSASSTLTFNASSTAATGTSNITITGTSGGVTATTTLPLVIHQPTFTLWAPPSLNMGAGTSVAAYLWIVDQFGFSSDVALSVSGLPSGVTASFKPNPAQYYSVLTLTASSSTALGSSTVTVTGTSGSITSSAAFKLNILAPAFELSTYNSIAIGTGKTATESVFVVPEYGFNGLVNLAITGLPSGVTASFFPNPSVAGFTTLTLTASSSAPLGTSTVTITGTSGSLKATTTFSLGVFVPTFVLSNGGAVSLGQGSSASTTVSVGAEYGFTGSVNLAASGLPSGVTASISPNPVTGTAQLTFTASSTAALGNSPVTVTGAFGTKTAKTTIPLSVFQPTFTLTGPGTVTLGAGSSVQSPVTVNPEYGFTGSVSLSLSGLPSGVTASFSLNPTSGSSAITLTASSTATPGTSTVAVTGVYGAKTVTTTFPLVIVAPGFTLSTVGPIELGVGTSTTALVNVNPQNGFTGIVQLAISGLPSGVTANFNPGLVTGTSTLTLTATGSAAVGSSTVTVTGASGTLKASTTIPLKIASPSFALSASGTVTISPGQTAVGSVHITPLYGFTGSVTFSIGGLPAGITASFPVNPTNQDPTINFSANSAAAVGTSTLTIKGTQGSKTATTTISLAVSPPLTLSGPASVQLSPGGNANAFLYALGSVSSGATTFSVSGLPSGVSAVFSPNPAYGSTTMLLTATKSAVVGTPTLTVTGTQGKTTASTAIQLQIQAPAFTLWVPSLVNVAPGGTAATQVNINPEFGFNGPVNLAVSGLPAGVTASWSSNPTTSFATLTLTASGTAGLSSKTVTITGTSGTLTASTTFQLVIAPPAFTVIVGGPLNISPGTRASTSVYVQWQGGFSDKVSLSISGLPAGLTASLSPASTDTSSTLTVTASSTAKLQQFNAVITGTYGKQTVLATLNVTVAAPGFTLFANGDAQVGRGSSTTNWISVNPQSGFNGSVSLSAAGLPSGVTASFSPNPTTSSSTMTLTASSTASLGEYHATIVGTFGAQKSTLPIAVSVYSPSFVLSSYQGPAISPGSSGQGTVSVQPSYGFTGSVRLSVSGLPSGVTASFLPNPTADQSTLTVTAASNVTPGQYNLTITGVSGNQTATTVMPLTISAPSFTLWSSGLSLALGASATTSVSIYSQNGFNKPVQLAIAGLPNGVTASFSPNPATFSAGSTTTNDILTVTATSSARVGEYAVTIIGSGGGQTATQQIPLTIGSSSFTLWSSQSMSLGQGGWTTQDVSVSSQFGFTGAVKFSVTGLPSGVAVFFLPNPASSLSTMMLTATKAAAAGQYNATIVGTSGTQSATWPFVLSVGSPGFTLSESESSLNLGQGQSASEWVYVVPNFGFAGQVSFSMSGLPSGVTASFSPNPSTSNSALTLTATSTVSAGNYVATIIGTSGTTKATMPLLITIGTPAFSLASSGSAELGPGSSTQAWVYVNSTFGSPPSVTLAASGLPSGMTASFSPNPTTFSSLLTLKASTSVAPGNYTITLSGSSGSQKVSTTMYVTVGAPTFTITACCGVNMGQGNSATERISVYGQYGFSAGVQLAVSGLPSGVTASLSPNPTTGNSTLTLTAASTAALGQYNVTVTGTSGTQTSSSTFSLAVYAPTFSVWGGGVPVVGQGTSATSWIDVNAQYGFNGNVQFTATGLPSGVAASFSPNPTTNSTLMTLTAASTASLGDYKFTVTGTSGSQKASTVLSVSIYAPTFTVSTGTGIDIGRGTSNSMWVNVYPQYGFNGNVKFAVSGLPSGVTASFSPNPTTSSSTLTLTGASTATLGQSIITVTGTCGSQSASTTFVLGVHVPTFTLNDYSDVTLTRGGTGQSNVYITDLYGFTGNVQLAVSGLPSGVTASFSPNPTTNSSTLTLIASATTSLGQYTLTITGTSGSMSASTTLTLGVYAPTFTLNDTSDVELNPGGTGQSWVYINDEYGFTGNVQLAVSGLPSGVTASFSPNSATYYSTLTLTAGSSITPGEYTLTITGASGSQKASTRIGLTVF